MATRPPRVTRAQIDELSRVVRNPEFLRMISEIEATPPDRRPRVARQFATREALSDRSIPLPEGFRVTLRWFEDGARPKTLAERQISPIRPEAELALARPTICASVGVVVCASI